MPRFRRFTHLPAEIRDQIWHFALQEAHKGRCFTIELYEKGPGMIGLYYSSESYSSKNDEIRNLLLSCREAREYAGHLEIKQFNLFPDVKFGTTEDDIRLYRFLRTVNLDFDTFRFQGRIRNRFVFGLTNPFPIWHTDVLQTENMNRLEFPAFLQHVRHIHMTEGKAIQLMHRLTVDRATRTNLLVADFRCLFFGSFAESPMRTCTFKARNLDGLALKIQELESYILDSDHEPSVVPPGLYWLLPYMPLYTRILQGRLKERRENHEPIWTEQERDDWLGQIRSFWEHEVVWTV
jgi:hypothetical protein